MYSFDLDQFKENDHHDENGKIVENHHVIHHEKDARIKDRIIQSIIDFIVILIIFALFLFVNKCIEPRIRFYTCDQTDILFPYKKDTVPDKALVSFGLIIPIFGIFFVELINSRMVLRSEEGLKISKFKKFIICYIHAISLFLLGMGITLLLTEIGKISVGRLRPHFIDVCKPDLSKLDCIHNRTEEGFVYNAIYTGNGFCTGDPKMVREARLSFPSGHSSFSSYAMVFFIIYLEARLFSLRFRFVKPLIQMCSFIACFVTSLSRVGDHYHRGSDVIGGLILGLTISLFITLVVGRVLWEYNRKKPYYDFDLIPSFKRKNQLRK